jgi:glucan phosphoethanolaminetransferase (alkaline phosphatase superfamily)
MEKAKNQVDKNEDVVFRKCKAVFVFWWMVFVLVLLMMFICLFVLDLESVWRSEIVQFFLLVELIIAIVIFEAYVNVLIVWESGVIFESWILVKSKREIPYNKINSVNISSVFWFWALEIQVGNDMVTWYNFLDRYEEAESLIKKRMSKSGD